MPRSGISSPDEFCVWLQAVVRRYLPVYRAQPIISGSSAVSTTWDWAPPLQQQQQPATVQGVSSISSPIVMSMTHWHSATTTRRRSLSNMAFICRKTTQPSTTLWSHQLTRFIGGEIAQKSIDRTEVENYGQNIRICIRCAHYTTLRNLQLALRYFSFDKSRDWLKIQGLKTTNHQNNGGKIQDLKMTDQNLVDL